MTVKLTEKKNWGQRVGLDVQQTTRLKKNFLKKKLLHQAWSNVYIETVQGPFQSLFSFNQSSAALLIIVFGPARMYE